MKKQHLFALALNFVIIAVMAQSTTYDIRLNQVGFMPNAIKQAAIVSDNAVSYRIVIYGTDSVVFESESLPVAYYSASEENVTIADFTLLTEEGKYVLVVDEIGKSVPFSISKQMFYNLSKASIKGFYYNRASMAIESTYGGIFARSAGHPDTEVVVLPSAASATRPAGTVISTPKGWYDAGDYNKYVVNSGISTFTLLSAYETFPEYYDTISLNIPESDNQIPDILDEALWNIQWLMSMQDPADGGVYNKTTTANFSGMVMPAQATATRYVVAKGTAATLDFAALMAMTARIYKKYDQVLADSALNMAVKAWQWAKSNPNVEFNNPSSSGSYPSVGTGGYGDSKFDDEFLWSAAELYITTKNDTYYNEIDKAMSFGVPGWGDVKTLGLLSLIVHKDSLTAAADTSWAKTQLITLVDKTVNNLLTSAYRIPGDYFYWGGNSAYANYGMLYMQAFKLTNNANYFNASVAALDYLLGRNATTYSFVTGAGSKSPMHIHHRISEADGVTQPVPGLLAGGPNPGNMDDCGASQYPSSLPALAYADKECSYSTNEIAINWSAPLAFLSGAIYAEYLNNFIDVMPVYFTFSTSSIPLPSNAGYEFELLIEGNSSWSLRPANDWILVSDTNGLGASIVKISSNSDNNEETVRSGLIYVFSENVLRDSIEVKQTGKSKSFKIEAEDYIEMTGLQTESASDIGGGENIGYVDPGDWATYQLDVAFDGVYKVTFRHAGYKGSLDIVIDNVVAKTVTYAATSDWQDWESHVDYAVLTEGEHVMKLAFKSAGTNLNWINFEWLREVSVNNELSHNEISVYPVPAKNNINVSLASSCNSLIIDIISLDGSVLKHQEYYDTNKAILDINGIKDGIYILRVNTGGQVVTQKIVVH